MTEARPGHASAQNKTCRKCKEVKPLTSFPKDLSRPDGLSHNCKICERIRRAEYSKRADAKKKQAIRARAYYAENPLKHALRRKKNRLANGNPPRDPFKDKARWKLREAVRRGDVHKPSNCQDCGASAPLHGHHEDYNKPLDVDWLCRPCHAKRHRKYPDEPNPIPRRRAAR